MPVTALTKLSINYSFMVQNDTKMSQKFGKDKKLFQYRLKSHKQSERGGSFPPFSSTNGRTNTSLAFQHLEPSCIQNNDWDRHTAHTQRTLATAHYGLPRRARTDASARSMNCFDVVTPCMVAMIRGRPCQRCTRTVQLYSAMQDEVALIGNTKVAGESLTG